MAEPNAQTEQSRALDLLDRLFTTLNHRDVHNARWQIDLDTDNGGRFILDGLFGNLKEVRQLVRNLPPPTK